MVPVLETERLRLRGHRREDFAPSAAMWGDESVTRFISGRPFTRSESWQRFLRNVGHWEMLGFGYWVVEAKADGRFVGQLGFGAFKRDLDPVIDLPEAGWVLAASEHGKGYATEAMTAALAWADERFERSFALFDPAHTASQHVATKLGFGDPAEVLYAGAPALVLYRNRPAR